MKKLIRNLALATTTAVLSLSLVFVLSGHQLAMADAKSDACAGVQLASGGSSTCGSPTDAGNSVSKLVATIINILSLIVGVAAVIMIIVGGFRYVISSGDSNNTNSARNTILYAIVGLVIVALAQVIVHFVLNKVA